MASPLHYFLSDLRLGCGASSLTNIEIVADNAVSPAHSKTEEKMMLRNRHGELSKPTRPNRIAAKGISFLASTLPKELEPVMRPKEEEQQQVNHATASKNITRRKHNHSTRVKMAQALQEHGEKTLPNDSNHTLRCRSMLSLAKKFKEARQEQEVASQRLVVSHAA